MTTEMAILVTQIPIAIAILIGAIIAYQTKQELVAILNKLSKKNN